MNAKWFDVGVNLNSSQFNADREAVVQRARQHGVEQQLLIASDLDESRAVAALAEQFSLYATAGVHPHQASTWNEHSADALMALACADRVVAIGECGLDFNRHFSPPEAQRTAFAAQLQIAARLQKTVYCHCRDAHDEFIALLDPIRVHLPRVIVHCFTGTRDELAALIRRDCYIGITGWIADERRGLPLQEAVRDIPFDRLLLETDAPYLLPRTLHPKPASRRNEPAFLPVVAQAVARATFRDGDELQRQCWRNSLAAFDLE